MARFQNGWLVLAERKNGPTWLYKYHRLRDSDGKSVQNHYTIGLKRDFPSEAKAWAEVERLGLRLRVNKPDGLTKPTFAAITQHYIDSELGSEPSDVVRPKAHTTVIRTRRIIDGYLLPRWADSIAEDIEPAEVRKWLMSVKKERQLADTTVLKIRNTMSWIYKCAQGDGLVPRHAEANPIKFVRVSTVSDYEALTITPAQVMALMRKLPAAERMLVFLIAGTGLRASECLGLQWADVDFEQGQIFIRRKWCWGQLGRPKTKASRGVVPLHPLLAKALREWRKVSMYDTDQDWLFPSDVSKGQLPRWSGQLVKDYIRPAAIRAGILQENDPRRFGLHNLRHSLATYLVTKNVDPKTVQSLLRHANVSTTLALYAHAVDGQRRKAQGQMLLAITKKAG